MASRLQKRYALVAGKRIGNLRFLESGVLQYSSASVDQLSGPPDARPRFHSAIAIASVARCVANATIQSFVEIVSQHHGVVVIDVVRAVQQDHIAVKRRRENRRPRIRVLIEFGPVAPLELRPLGNVMLKPASQPVARSRLRASASSTSRATSKTASGATWWRPDKIEESNVSSDSKTRKCSSLLYSRAGDFFTGQRGAAADSRWTARLL